MNKISCLRRFAVLISILSAVSAVAEEDSVVDEIVVTADFRERPVQQLPASVSVLDAAFIESSAVQHFEELVNVIPNLNWSGDGHRARYFQIRGIGELEQYQGAPNPSIGFLIDDIDFSGIGSVATLFDIQRVEVLRGPQGSRYGANALAGLVYMQSAEPDTEPTGEARLTTASDGAAALGVALGGPLTEAGEFRYRFSAHYHSSDGFRDNPFLGRADTNGRTETTLQLIIQLVVLLPGRCQRCSRKIHRTLRARLGCQQLDCLPRGLADGRLVRSPQLDQTLQQLPETGAPRR